MTRLTKILALAALAACGSRPATVPAPATAPPTAPAVVPAPKPVAGIYARIPAQVGQFRIKERAAVTGVPTDSLFRYTDGTPTVLTVFIYEVSENVRVDADSQKWTFREGDKFRQVQQIRAQRRDFADHTVAFSDSTRFAVGPRMILEHSIATPVKQNSGAIVVDFQYLYLIDGKFVKVRATVPEAGWQRTTVGLFARALARIVAGGT